jgi:hypothetical protein
MSALWKEYIDFKNVCYGSKAAVTGETQAEAVPWLFCAKSGLTCFVRLLLSSDIVAFNQLIIIDFSGFVSEL